MHWQTLDWFIESIVTRYFIIHFIPFTTLSSYTSVRLYATRAPFWKYFFFQFNCSFSTCLRHSVCILLLSVNIRLITADVFADFNFYLIKYWVSALFINLSVVLCWILKIKKFRFIWILSNQFSLKWEHCIRICMN